MKNKTYFLNTALALILAVGLLVAVLVRTFAPIIIIPKPDIPLMMLVSLAALLADYYLAPGAKRCWVWVYALSTLTFGLLPWAACFVDGLWAVKLAAVGGVVFTVTAWLYTAICDRISTGPAGRAAPWVGALGLYLAGQSFMGLML
ncbi:MAG: hypothetical protein IJP02_05430 [Oscillospiraceae bacterium]|nr:hypothetical protein [Oscillospiraceae bacterium]